MKRNTKWFTCAAMGVAMLAATSCVDDMTFGSAFLEKAPGGSVTKDTVFNNAEYTRQFLNNLYGMQYYGLPYKNKSDQESSNIYVGKVDALTDLYIFTYGSSAGIYNPYFMGQHTANYGIRQDKFSYTKNLIWEAVRGCWLLLENIDNVPGLGEEEKTYMKAQAKCIMASRYLDVFRHYGGVPIIRASFSGTDASYDYPRGSVEETVNFIVGLLDEAAPDLPWTVPNPATDNGRWNRAAALAYKCRTLQFAASPLFNADQPYYPGVTDNPAIWYGGYRAELWQQLLQACEAFFNELNASGGYHLQQANGTRPEDYRLAYRIGYSNLDSPETLLSTRVIDYDAFKSSHYNWHQWGAPLGKIHRSYCPTLEYMEMFPWKDGTPFDYDRDSIAGRQGEMFMIGNAQTGNIQLTRDPRMYEEIIVNGDRTSIDWNTGNMSGRSFEAWYGGYDARTNTDQENGSWGTGFGPIKFLMNDDMLRRYVQWPSIRLSEMYLIYAEALAQTGNLAKAVEQVDIVRARVGMKGLVACNPDKNLTADKDALIEEILRERACELGMEDARFFDLIRYKRADVFEKQLHGLNMYRLDENGARRDQPWYGNDDKEGTEGYMPFPTKYDYMRFPLDNPTRYWWTNGFDPKWYLSPFPATEVNKGYGLVQNPGW